MKHLQKVIKNVSIQKKKLKTKIRHQNICILINDMKSHPKNYAFNLTVFLYKTPEQIINL